MKWIKCNDSFPFEGILESYQNSKFPSEEERKKMLDEHGKPTCRKCGSKNFFMTMLDMCCVECKIKESRDINEKIYEDGQLMKWIKCSERMPEKLGNYLVVIRHPKVEDFTFFKGKDAYDSIEFSCFKEIQEYKEQDKDTVTYFLKRYFYDISETYKLKNITHWLEATLPEVE